MKRNKLMTNNQKYLGHQHFPEGIEEVDLEIESEAVESVFDPNTKKTSIKQVVYFKSPPSWFPMAEKKPLPMIVNNTNIRLILQALNQDKIFDLKGLFVKVVIAYIDRAKEIIWFDDNNYEHKGTEKIIMSNGKEKEKKVKMPCLRFKDAWYPNPDKVREELREILTEYLSKFKPNSSIADFENKVGKIESFDYQTATKYINNYNNLLKGAKNNNN